MLNWIPDTNRFQVPAPPQWFLQMLWDQDAALVILPSRVKKQYILARRREFSLRAPVIVAAHNDLMRQVRGSDGDMLAGYNVQFVDVIAGNVNGTWSPAIIAALQARDTWALGGSAKYTAKLEAAEQAEVDKADADRLDKIEQQAKDSWRSLQARTGQRNHHAHSAPVRESSSSSTAGSESANTD